MTKQKQQTDDGSKPKRPYRERRIKFFDCIGPNHKGRKRSQSLKKRFAEVQLCRKCRKGVNINPNQLTMFETPCERGGIKHHEGCGHDAVGRPTTCRVCGEPHAAYTEDDCRTGRDLAGMLMEPPPR